MNITMDMFTLTMTLAGVDEAGRGPLAGPVIAAAVILDAARPIVGLADSKKLSARKRELLALEIRDKALAWAIGRVDNHEIDRINILQASLLAMKIAIENLSIKPQHVLVDGNQCPAIACSVTAIIKGDQTVPAISAASILAKVARDAEMIGLDSIYPGYGFARHKGYPTSEHISALEKLGACPIHRRSFAPVNQLA
jgi:ribonuclease HII